MIDEIHIRDVALIHDATFAPSTGFTAITGETGAGKTALLSALRLLSGRRADAGMIREGAEELSVEGRFYFGEDDQEGLVAARRVARNGRSRVSVDGSLASVKVLAQRVGARIDLCGQHENQRLLDPEHQREYLDAWGAEEIAPARERYRAALRRADEAAGELDRLLALESDDASALDRARYTLEKIDEVDPAPGEYEALLEEMPRYEHAESLVRLAHEARQALNGTDGIIDSLGVLTGCLSELARIDGSLAQDRDAAFESLYAFEDLARTLASYADGIDFSPAELESRQTRMSELQSLMRGFGPGMEQVFATREAAQRTISEFDSRDELIAQARAVVEEAESVLAACAAELARARASVAPRFVEAVCAQMARLEMGSARIQIAMEDLPRERWGAWGSQGFELLFLPGADMMPQRLGKIASGGEMSRVMLAIKVVLGECDDADTLVFDEIDAGVGGQTALALADVLADLARTHQVVVVTHLAQVAVRADAHYLVRKSGEGVPRTELSALEGSDRVDEVARMLSGSVDDVSREHAARMLAGQ